MTKHRKYNGAIIRPLPNGHVEADLGKTPTHARKRKKFPTECLARAWIDLEETSKAMDVAPRHDFDARDALRAHSLLPPGVSLTDAARFYQHTHPWEGSLGAPGTSLALNSAITRFLEEKAASGLRDRSYRSLRAIVNRLSADLGSRPIISIRGETLLDWLNAHGITGTTRDNYRRAFNTLFNWCVRAKYIPDNPAAIITKPRVDPGPPAILTPEQLTALLHAAQTHDPDCIPPIAIGAFAGLRSAEIARLHWTNIHLPDFPKSGAPPGRLAKQTPEKRSSSPCGTFGDASPIIPNDYRRRFQRLRKTAGIDPWPTNCLRHSFATYHLALHQDAGKTAHELGHRNPTILYAHYRNLATLNQAQAWFNVLP